MFCVYSVSLGLKQRSPTPGPRTGTRSVGHLVPGRTERINNLHYFRFIYYLSLNDVLFRKITRFSLLHLSMTHSWRMSRRLSRSRDTLPLKAGPWKYCLTLNRSVVQRGLGTTGLKHSVWQKCSNKGNQGAGKAFFMVLYFTGSLIMYWLTVQCSTERNSLHCPRALDTQQALHQFMPHSHNSSQFVVLTSISCSYGTTWTVCVVCVHVHLCVTYKMVSLATAPANHRNILPAHTTC